MPSKRQIFLRLAEYQIHIANKPIPGMEWTTIQPAPTWKTTVVARKAGSGHGLADSSRRATLSRLLATNMIIKERMTASLDDDFVVFLIGVRINQPWKIHKWLPIGAAMPRMLRELYAQPELRLLHHEMWFSRTTIQMQYWRSMDHLLNYARNKEVEHLPAWAAFNRAIGTDGSVGIWHETYAISKGNYEVST